MKTILKAGIVGVILFAISASASWYLTNQNVEPEEEEIAELDLEEDAGVPPIGGEIEKEEKMPVAIRPDVPLTVEAVLKLSESIRKKERELIEREKQIVKSERNVDLLFADLKVERSELTQLAKQLEERIDTARNSVSLMRVENQELKTQAMELTKAQEKNEQLAKDSLKSNKSGQAELEMEEIAERVRTAKPWFEGLADEQAAKYLREFANNGELKFAALLLKSLNQRKASKILAAFDEPEFVQQILESLSESDKDQEAIEKSARLKSRIAR
jgi:hypothetical protein